MTAPTEALIAEAVDALRENSRTGRGLPVGVFGAMTIILEASLPRTVTAGSKTAAQLLRERREAGLTAADIPKAYGTAPEPADVRVEAWNRIASHPFFRECYATEGTLLAAMLAKLDEVHKYLTALDEYDDHPVEENFWDDRTTTIEGGTA